MKNLLLIIGCSISFSIQAQIALTRFQASSLCDSVAVETLKVRPHLHAVSTYKDSLKIAVRLYENCGLDLRQGAIAFVNDSLTLMWTPQNVKIKLENVIYENGTWFHPDSAEVWSSASCNCYMELVYVITGIKKVPPLRLKNKAIVEKDSMYRLYVPQFERYNGDTINFIDHLGIKRGKWMEFDSFNRIIYIENIISPYFSNEFETFSYHKNGEVKEHYHAVRKKNGFQISEKFDSKGVIREREFISDFYMGDDDYFDIHYIEYFDENGALIKRETKELHTNLYENADFSE